MKITYISHATLLIEAGDLRIVTDPWVKGSAYCEQWYLFPKPVAPSLIQDADVVLYSHGHEDHLHIESLLTIDSEAKVFYPYSWYPGTPAFFTSLGFKNNNEILNEQCIELSKDVRVTYLANNLDTVMVIEHGSEVLVNINDALPSASTEMIGHMLDKIKKRWSNITYVFSSFGSAGYFPNTVHYKDKDDIEIGRLREHVFLNNFCRIVDELAPTIAVPFASDFALLDDRQRWINDIKFPRHKISDYFIEQTENNKVTVAEAYAGDLFELGKQHKASPYHSVFAKQSIKARIEEDYAIEIEAKRNPVALDTDTYSALKQKLRKHIERKKGLIPQVIRNKIKFALKLTDSPVQNWIVVDFRQGKLGFETSDAMPTDVDLHIELKSATLQYTLEQEWGGDAIVIGYGAEIHVYHEDAVRLEMENYCIRLLSRYPNMKEYLPKAPLRGVRYLLSDSIKRTNLLRQITGKSESRLEYSDQKLGDRPLWLSKGKCEVCKACNIAFQN